MPEEDRIWRQSPTFEHLREHCLFCDPARHGQEEQILLRSDSFFLFAGLGAIINGYILIAPHRCDDPALRVRSLSEVPPDLMDELGYVRGIVSDFYRDVYGDPGLSFEHARAGGCLVDRSDTRHCYHAHLCCYPKSFRLWEDVEGQSPVELAGLHELPAAAGSAAYLYVETVEIDETVPVDKSGREKWTARIFPVAGEEPLKSQYLRRLLAQRVGAPELWDWHAHPRVDLSRSLVDRFREWLGRRSRYAIRVKGGAARLRFLDSVVRSNVVGNDDVAEEFHRKWGHRVQMEAIGRLLRHLPKRDSKKDGSESEHDSDTPLRLLDAGCGPGNYSRVFFHLGFDCIGIDISPKMLDIAREVLEMQSGTRGPGEPPPPPRLVPMDAMEPRFLAETFDVIWYSAILVHVPRAQLPGVLASLRRILKADGVAYLSAQTGGGLRVRYEGRVFVYYSEEELRSALHEAGFEILEQWRDTVREGTRRDKEEKYWIHFVVKKKCRHVEAPVPSPLRLVDLGERGLHERIAARVAGPAPPHVLLGLGDDCAALRVDETAVVVTTDPCPRPVLSMLSGRDRVCEGWFSMAIGLSDLAAMGARPLGALLAIEAEEQMKLEELDAFYAGVLEAAERFDCPILGGNVKDAASFSCVATTLGAVDRDAMLRRDAARPGQYVVVLGEMGRFWAGVMQRLEGLKLEEGEAEILLESLRRPRPRVREGRALAEECLSHCAMDSSDGLTACFDEIARAGRDIDLHIDLSEVTPEPAVQRVAEATGIDVRKLLLAWGDWELVCTVEPIRLERVRERMAEFGCPVSVVGWVSAGTSQVWFHDPTRRGLLSNFASERFTSGSYFSHGLDVYVRILRNRPLFATPTE